MSDADVDIDDRGLEELADALEGAGLLTRRQAEAWLLRYHSDLSRAQAADELGIGRSVFDDHRRDADDKIEAARATARIVDSLEATAPETVDDVESELDRILDADTE